MAVVKQGIDTSTKHDSTSVYNFSFDHTLVASTGGSMRRVVFVSVGGETTVSETNPPWSVTGITYGGQPMTLLVREVTTENGPGLSNNSSELWIIKDVDLPATNGVKTIVVSGTTTNGAQVYLFGVAAQYDHVDQTIPASSHGAFFNGPVPSDTIANSVDPHNADLVVSSYVSGNAGTFTVGQGQVEIYDQQNDTGPTNTFAVCELTDAPPGPYDLTSTYVSGANRLTRCAASLVAWRQLNFKTDLMKVNGVSRHDMGPINGVL